MCTQLESALMEVLLGRKELQRAQPGEEALMNELKLAQRLLMEVISSEWMHLQMSLS